MFHNREVDWSSYISRFGMETDDTTSVVDTQTGERRLTVQSPIFMEYSDSHTGPMFSGDIPSGSIEVDNDGTESDGYSTPDEEFDNTEMTTIPERRFFTTPCGQTYWVDGDLYLYTNETVEIPIGYWCDRDQCVYLDDGSGDTTDEEDEYDPPPTPPPIYEETDSINGSPSPMDTHTDSGEAEGENQLFGVSPMDTHPDDSEVEGENILIAPSQ